MKKVCEVQGHKRPVWALLAFLLAGVTIGLSVGHDDLGRILPSALLSFFALGVYLGVIKLDKPKKTPKEAPKEAPKANE